MVMSLHCMDEWNKFYINCTGSSWLQLEPGSMQALVFTPCGLWCSIQIMQISFHNERKLTKNSPPWRYITERNSVYIKFFPPREGNVCVTKVSPPNCVVLPDAELWRLVEVQICTEHA